MRIDTILESTLRNSTLKRVRIKIDPAQLVMQAYHLLDSYEGYVLEECGDSIKVYMMDLPGEFDPIQTVNKQHVSDAPVHASCGLKNKVLQQLEKEGIAQDNPVYQKIQKAQSDEFLDSYLSEIGYDDKKIIEFYKKIVSTPIAEGIADVLQKTASRAKDITSSPIFKGAELLGKGIAKVPGLVVGKDNIIGRIAKFLHSFDVNDLITASKNYDEKDPRKIHVGVQVYIGNCEAVEGLEFINRYKKVEVGSKKYDLIGTIEERLFTKNSKSYNINIVHPSEVEHKYDLRLSYPEVYNKTKTGVLSFLPKDRDTEPKHKEVQVLVTQKYILVQILPKNNEPKSNSSADVKKINTDPSLATTDLSKEALNQDVVKLAVEKSILQFLGDRKLTDLPSVVSIIAENILRIGEKKGMESFKEGMLKLVEDKKASVSGDPQHYIRKYLEPAGLLQQNSINK